MATMMHGPGDVRLCAHEVAIGPLQLPGTLAVPARPEALIVFVHGSGSSRMSPRNREVAGALQRRGFATLLFDLLTGDEATDRHKVFDVALLAQRLSAALAWRTGERSIEGLPCGLFGASTGAAAALTVASRSGADIYAIVSRGGRPDLAPAALHAVPAPTLLIVGGEDPEVLELNRSALAAMRCECRLSVVPGATHLFEEPGALDAVATLASDWFATHLPEGHHGTMA